MDIGVIYRDYDQCRGWLRVVIRVEVELRVVIRVEEGVRSLWGDEKGSKVK